ncbi:glutamyl-tRNA reductase [Rhodoluna sp.]|uniref:glutamyl-tRNA reductase n=1 Tax=Rhodoluna sp. TaxID=1969481 RepID=UPI0025F21C1C|nr:glutamyl-tRNA reductase [Rhodoluna sp.]
MGVILVGTDHREASLEELDLLAKNFDSIRQGLLEKQESGLIQGFVGLTTCNRFELYLETKDSHSAGAEVLRVIADNSEIDADYCAQVFQVAGELAAARHLFSVTAGLESMVIGEEEIAGQVRKAFASAQDGAQTSAALNQLFQKAASVAKKVTTQTGLGAAGRSTITVGLDILKAQHGELAGKQALLIGTGAHARVVVAALIRAGINEISVYSPTGRAAEFANSRGLQISENLNASLAHSDLVVACSGHGSQLIGQNELRAARASGSKELMIIDVALSHDVAADVAELDGVTLVNLETIKHHTPHEHTAAVLQARELVNEATDEFQAEQLGRNLDPFVTAIKRKLNLWIDEEVARVELREGAETAAEVRASLNSLANQMLHEPLTTAKALAATGDDENYRRALMVLFGGRDE